MSTYSSHSDFDNYHQSSKEVCDYVLMKTEMLSGLSNSSNVDLMAITELDIDASWLDFGDVFEGIFDGLGELVLGSLKGFKE